MKVMRDGALVPLKYKRSTKQNAQRTFDKIRSHYKQDWDAYAISILREANKVKAFLRSIDKKTPLDLERDRTIQDEAEGAIARRDADDDEEINQGAITGTVSRAATAVRARDKSSEPKDYIKSTYSHQLENIVATW